MATGKGTGNDEVTHQETEARTTQPATVGISKKGKLVMQPNPAKAPQEMTNAIRRRRETSDLDYLHTLPPPQPRRLFKAVLRGALTADNTMCTLSSILDAANQREFKMVIGRNSQASAALYSGNGNPLYRRDFNVRAEDMGLTISGLKINETRLKQETALISQKSSGWKGYSAAYSTQKKMTGPTKQGKLNAPNNNDARNNNDSEKYAKLSGSNLKTASPPPTNVKTAQRSPRLSLTNRQSNGDMTDARRSPLSPRTEYESRKVVNTSLDLPRNSTAHKNTLLRQTSLPLTSCEPKSFSNNSNENNILRGCVPSSQMETSMIKRKFANEIDNCKRVSKPNSFPPSSACLQFADSILGALTVDLNQMYSICQAKVRYAEFIEQSQSHRLGGKDPKLQPSIKDNVSVIKTYGQSENKTKENNDRNDSRLSQNPAKESSSTPSSPSSSSSSYKLQTKSGYTDINRNAPPLRLRPIPAKTNKFISPRDSQQDNDNIDLDKPVRIVMESDLNSSRVKMARPILKSSKTDIDSSFHSFRQSNDNIDTNNNTNNVNNRLVRFNVNHEVREFAPSEPVRNT